MSDYEHYEERRCKFCLRVFKCCTYRNGSSCHKDPCPHCDGVAKARSHHRLDNDEFEISVYRLEELEKAEARMVELEKELFRVLRFLQRLDHDGASGVFWTEPNSHIHSSAYELFKLEQER